MQNVIFLMAHTHENQKEGLQFSSQYSLWARELELHQDAGEKSSATQWLLAAADEETKRGRWQVSREAHGGSEDKGSTGESK